MFYEGYRSFYIIVATQRPSAGSYGNRGRVEPASHQGYGGDGELCSEDTRSAK